MSFDRTKSRFSWLSRRKLKKRAQIFVAFLPRFFAQCSNGGEESDKRVHKFGFSLFGSTRF